MNEIQRQEREAMRTRYREALAQVAAAEAALVPIDAAISAVGRERELFRQVNGLHAFHPDLRQFDDKLVALKVERGKALDILQAARADVARVVADAGGLQMGEEQLQ